jgi:hypothetical protein
MKIKMRWQSRFNREVRYHPLTGWGALVLVTKPQLKHRDGGAEV